MDPNERRLLQEILDLVEENHRLLKKMRRSQLLGRFLTMVYWIIIIGAAAGSFYFIKPYVNGLITTYTNISNTAQETSKTLNQLKNSDAGQYLIR